MVATYGGVETKVDDWKIDIAVAGTQNVSAYLQASLITYNQRVADYLAGRYQKS